MGLTGVMGLVGIVLAAGAGSRAGGPKALRADGGRPWVVRASQALRGGGCTRVLVVLGAASDEARALVAPGDDVVVAGDWADGLSASLRAGLAGAAEIPDAVAAVVTLVDLPDLPSTAVRRVSRGAAPEVLRRAVVHGRPSHPVLLGRDHWPALAAELTGDAGANAYLRAHAADVVECGDLWSGLDTDTPPTA